MTQDETEDFHRLVISVFQDCGATSEEVAAAEAAMTSPAEPRDTSLVCDGGCAVSCHHCHTELTKLTACVTEGCPIKAVWTGSENTTLTAALKTAEEERDQLRQDMHPYTYARTQAERRAEAAESALATARTALERWELLAKQGYKRHGVGIGSVTIRKWDASEALHYTRAALAVPGVRTEGE